MIVYAIYHNKCVCNMTMGEIHFKHFANEAYNNARSCKITTTPPPTPTKKCKSKGTCGNPLKP